MDIYCDAELAAAVFTLSYDPAAAEFREASAVSSSGSVKAKDEGGLLRLAFCDEKGSTGKIIRLGFSALGDSAASFVLNMDSGVDPSLNYIKPYPEYTLSASLSAGGSGGLSSSGSSVKVSNKGEGSSLILSGKTYSDSSFDEPETRFIDLSLPTDMRYFFLGAGAALLAALLVILGFILGRRASAKKRSKKENPPTESEAEDELIE